MRKSHNKTLKHRSGLRPPLDAQSSARLCICFANFRTNQLHFVRRLALRYELPARYRQGRF
ncbi:MAG: hypothetical protein CML20_11570 [Rheinheimera sp.]|nr:hypothetical protein [Rheinheimera sp.]